MDKQEIELFPSLSTT